MGAWQEIKKLEEIEFQEEFATREQCLEFLATEKWKDGYICRKCGHTHYCKGKTPFSRRCTKCKSEESATAHTMFHRCRIHLPEAFSILYTVCRDPEVTSTHLSNELEMRLMTCWRFKKKVMECLADRSGFSIIKPRISINTFKGK